MIPHIRPYRGLTQKSKMEQKNEYQLRQLSGWSPRSQASEIHTYHGNEANERLLEANGIVTRQLEHLATEVQDR